MKLSAAIMAHPVRRPYVDELCAVLDREIPVVWDPLPVSRDPEQRWETCRRAWEMADDDADFHLVLQDDALVARDFLAGLERALDHLPPRTVMSPYYHARPAWARDANVHLARLHGASWIVLPRMTWGIAMIAPVGTIPRMLLSASNMRGQDDDFRVGNYYRVHGWKCWYLWPPLVGHRPGPSLVGHAYHRVEPHWHQDSALDIDLNGPVIAMRHAQKILTTEEARAYAV